MAVPEFTVDNTIRRQRFACCITKATDTHSEYVILIAFPLKLLLHERAVILRYMQTACLVLFQMFPPVT
jgi:hypothetical protein